MKSQGPFKIYDHAATKGDTDKVKKINSQAQKRFQNELHQIKDLRDVERQQFYSSKDK